MADSSAAFAFQLALSTDQVNVANHVYAPLQTLDAQFLKGTDIATTGGVITLPAVTAGNYFDFTGALAITGFSARTAGHRIYGQLDAAAQLTHNGTSCILPGAANIPGAAGNRFCFISEGAGNWRCLWYTRADGTAPAAGLIVQTTLTTSTTKVTATNQDTETHILQGTLTPKAIGNTVYVIATLNGINPGGTGRAHTLLRWEDNVSGGVTGTQIGGTQLNPAAALNQGTVMIGSFVTTSLNAHYAKVTFAKRDSSTTWETIDQGADDRSSVLMMEQRP